MNKKQKKEIKSKFLGFEEDPFDTRFILYDGNNQHLFYELKEYSPKEIEDYLISISRLKDRMVDYDYDGKNQVWLKYTIPAFFKNCSEKYGETQATILSNLFFISYAKFNRWHFNHCDLGILNFDIVVPEKLVGEVSKAFDLLFELRNGKKEYMKIIKLSNGAIFEMDIVCFYYYVDTNMFIYNTKLFSNKDFILVGEKLKTEIPKKDKWEKEDYPDIIGKWQPEKIDNPETNPAHPESKWWRKKAL